MDRSNELRSLRHVRQSRSRDGANRLDGDDGGTVRAGDDRIETDRRGCRITGATPAALEWFERALAANLGWRSGADVDVAVALQHAPAFVMAHVLQAYLLVCSRDPQRVRAARAVLGRAATLPANARERIHLDAIAAVLDDDIERAKARLGELLRTEPRDALALQAGHALDYLSGDPECLRLRVAGVLPAWSSAMPGYPAVLAMHAFGLEESGEYALAERAARAALTLDPSDARAHHVMAHVFEMTDRPRDGVAWLESNVARWDRDTVVATHCWWHLALFELTLGDVDRALALYDGRVRATRSAAVADLIDAAALLWRIALAGRDAGARWSELADAWAPHIEDRFCSFSDLHAMLAFVGAGDRARAHRLERVLDDERTRATRHGATTRLLGLAACRALIAFGDGDDALAVALLASLPAQAYRLGGSHAQRDVLHLTLIRAVARLRRPARAPRDTEVRLAA